MLKRNENHTTDLLFTLGLFCVFAASAFLLVMIGLRVYRSTAAGLEDTFSTRTAISYVAEKLRRHDTAGAVALTELEDVPALRLTDRAGGDDYDTYIYSDGAWLYELTVRRGTEVSMSMGEQIIEVQDFTIRDAGDGFWEFTASDSAGDTVRFITRLRSDAA